MQFLKVDLRSSHLKFRFPFRIAHGTRTGTDAVFVRLAYKGFYGYGEATLPPYLIDTTQSTLDFLVHPFFSTVDVPFEPMEINERMSKLFSGNYPARAAFDMALWQLKSQIEGKNLSEMVGTIQNNKVPHSYTIGIGTRDEMRVKLKHGIECGFTFFKLKLNGQNDDEVLEDYLSFSQFPFAVDANQSWSSIQEAILFSKKLQDKGCILIEQPFEKSDRVKSKLLNEQIDIPIIADEACQTVEDLQSLDGVFDGINIKLQKCGGITNALEMISAARKLNMKVLIGCMSESSIGCDAAEALAPLCDWADLDGPWLITDNPKMNEIFL